MKPVVTNHPLIQHKLTILRQTTTSSKDFRELVSEIANLLCYEATRDLSTIEIEIDTPMSKTKSKVIAGRKLALVPILRAGLGMCEGMLSLIPGARIGHIGMYRDHNTHKPVEYFCKLPSDISQRDAFILDPMLATGGSAIDAVNALKARNVSNIKFICIIAAPEGIEALSNAHPDVQIYAAAIDECLDENKYIIPGLGDAGDRIFGTK